MSVSINEIKHSLDHLKGKRQLAVRRVKRNRRLEHTLLAPGGDVQQTMPLEHAIRNKM